MNPEFPFANAKSGIFEAWLAETKIRNQLLPSVLKAQKLVSFESQALKSAPPSIFPNELVTLDSQLGTTISFWAETLTPNSTGNQGILQISNGSGVAFENTAISGSLIHFAVQASLRTDPVESAWGANVVTSYGELQRELESDDQIRRQLEEITSLLVPFWVQAEELWARFEGNNSEANAWALAARTCLEKLKGHLLSAAAWFTGKQSPSWAEMAAELSCSGVGSLPYQNLLNEETRFKALCIELTNVGKGNVSPQRVQIVALSTKVRSLLSALLAYVDRTKASTGVSESLKRASPQRRRP